MVFRRCGLETIRSNLLNKRMLFLPLFWIVLHCAALGNSSRTEKDDSRFFTHLNGEVAEDITNTISLGKNGPIVLYDQNFYEQISHFNREKILPRRVGVIGSGAFGHFECTSSELRRLTRASLFSRIGKITAITTRFALASPSGRDLESNRFFFTAAIRFYSDEGNLDLTMVTPRTATARDGASFVDGVRATSLTNNVPFSETLFDYPSLRPEFLHVTLFNHMDNSLPDGWRHMNTFSPSTHKLINSKGEIHYARFKLTSLPPSQYLDNSDGAWIGGHYPDYFSRDLVLAIKRGDYPKWLLQAQVMAPEESEKIDFNPFDVTKVWDEKRFPFITFGKIVLNRIYDNFFAQNEQAAFNPSNMVPGLDITLDKSFQARSYAYRDGQNYRLGINHQQLSINRPIVPVNAPTIRDGLCADPKNGGSEPNYFPNSYIRPKPFGYSEPLVKLPEVELKRWNTSDDNNYSQVNMTWSRLDEGERSRTLQRIASPLAAVSMAIQRRFLGQIKKVNLDFYNKLVDAIKATKRALVNGPSCTCNRKLLGRFNLDYIRKK